MRGFLFPCAVLAVILGATIANGIYVTSLCDGWIEALHTI